MARRLPLDADHPAYDPSACGPDGHALCRRCLGEIRERRRDGVCSDRCLHDFRMRASPSYARAAVYARDHGMCTHCRLDCGLLDRVLRRLTAPVDEVVPVAGVELSLRIMADVGLGRHKRVISTWQADHRVAVAEGGQDCGLGNFRTLCLACHAKQTRDLHRRLHNRGQEH
jgi:5-methylcytosine-specific restriction protein A